MITAPLAEYVSFARHTQSTEFAKLSYLLEANERARQPTTVRPVYNMPNWSNFITMKLIS